MKAHYVRVSTLEQKTDRQTSNNKNKYIIIILSWTRFYLIGILIREGILI